VRNLFQRSKDATIGFAARSAINSRLRGIGQVIELSIDTTRKTIRARLELLGESEPIDVDITSYRLRTNDRGTEVIIENATTSREWMNVALQQFVIGKSFPVPPKAEGMLKMLA
jgi:hypothetical protein